MQTGGNDPFTPHHPRCHSGIVHAQPRVSKGTWKLRDRARIIIILTTAIDGDAEAKPPEFLDEPSALELGTVPLLKEHARSDGGDGGDGQAKQPHAFLGQSNPLRFVFTATHRQRVYPTPQPPHTPSPPTHPPTSSQNKPVMGARTEAAERLQRTDLGNG